MNKTSSEKSIYTRAVAMAMAVFLCLGGFFLFSCGHMGESVDADRLDSVERTVFIKGKALSDNSLSLSAHSAVLIEASSGEIIFSKNATERMPMASTTKIMTALVALENCELSKVVSVSPNAVGVEGSSIYLSQGEKVTMEDLLYAMLLESANDAAAAIAIEVGGSVEGFAEMMNKKASDMGLTNTHFENPHGLDGETHYTTAYELALIAREALKNDTFKKIVSTHRRTMPLKGGEGTRVLINHNKLLNSYEGAIGVKTGFTKKSGRCLVSAAEKDGLTFIAVTLKAPDDWQDHTKMLDLGFSLYEARTLCAKGSFSYIMPVSGGEDDHVMLENYQKVTVIIPRDKNEIKCTVELPRFLIAPVNTGEVIGRLVFYLDGEEIAQADITAKSSVADRQSKTNLFNRLLGR